MSSRRAKFLAELRGKAGISCGQTKTLELTAPNSDSGLSNGNNPELHFTIEYFQPDEHISVKDLPKPVLNNKANEEPNANSAEPDPTANVLECQNDTYNLDNRQKHITAEDSFISSAVSDTELLSDVNNDPISDISDDESIDIDVDDDRDKDFVAVFTSSSSDSEDEPLNVLRKKLTENQKNTPVQTTGLKRGRKSKKGDTREARKKRKYSRN